MPNSILKLYVLKAKKLNVSSCKMSASFFPGGRYLDGRSQLPMIRARESKSAPVGVVGKVLRILEALDGSPTGLELREIAE